VVDECDLKRLLEDIILSTRGVDENTYCFLLTYAIVTKNAEITGVIS